MKVIGITGPTGAGKTTALQVLGEMGAEIIDADAVYHGLLSDSAPMRQALAEAFGPGILDDQGQVDRKRLAGAVYPGGLDKLNAITHPFVVEQVDRLLDQARQAGRPAAAIDAIALIESGLDRRCDRVVAVLAPPSLRVRRIMERDGIDEAYARRRVLAQREDGFFRSHAHAVLENGPEDTPGSFAARARRLFEGLLCSGKADEPEKLSGPVEKFIKMCYPETCKTAKGGIQHGRKGKDPRPASPGGTDAQDQERL